MISSWSRSIRARIDSNGNQILAGRYLVTEPVDPYISKYNQTTN
jgi:hypothetical protein